MQPKRLPNTSPRRSFRSCLRLGAVIGLCGFGAPSACLFQWMIWRWIAAPFSHEVVLASAQATAALILLGVALGIVIGASLGIVHAIGFFEWGAKEVEPPA